MFPWPSLFCQPNAEGLYQMATGLLLTYRGIGRYLK
jgi:hypothetical protein